MRFVKKNEVKSIKVKVTVKSNSRSKNRKQNVLKKSGSYNVEKAAKKKKQQETKKKMEFQKKRIN